MKPTVEVEMLEVGKHDGGGRRLAAAGERARLLTAFDASELTQREFARQEGVNYFTFAGWLRQRRLQQQRLLAPPAEKSPAFVEVSLPKPMFAVEVVLADGTIVRAHRAAELVACVRGLR